ncbi:MAG TPA: SGNH/GDSL hydrolase family protein [Acidimicrobiales bacterium]|nr:SGNH/GDSL hydrolase family protein [Acidimicrobiales bacterium]
MTTTEGRRPTRPHRRHRRRRRAVAVVAAVAVLGAGVWGLRAWRLHGQVERYRRYWSVPRGQPGGLVYVALGDSSAQGIGASEPELGYVGLLAARLRAATGQPVQVVNLSRSGARVRDVVDDQLPALAGLRPDLVTVTVGANDLGRYQRARFRADVDELLAGLPPNTVIGDVPWFMHGGAGRNSGEAAEWLAARAAERDLAVAGLHEAMRRRGWLSMATDFAADWFHLSDRGYRVWVGEFWGALQGSPALAVLTRRGAA